MTGYLLDANVLIALAWPHHVHHESAHQWFQRNHSRKWATCPMTQCAFVRISSNPAFNSNAVSPQDAMEALRKIVALPDHLFWRDELPLIDKCVPASRLVGHRQVTDAYLLGLAIHRGGQLATFDRGFPSLLSPAEAVRHIAPIPVA